MTVVSNAAELLLNGHEILPALLADLRAARSSIHVSMFLWFHDPIGDELADALVLKAKQGVRVRVLLNIQKTGMGDPFSTGEKEMMDHDPAMKHNPLDVSVLCQRMREAGIEVVDTNIDYDKVLPTLSPRLRSVAAQIRGSIAIDDLHIDHRKIIVIDACVGYAGGANIGAQYMYHVAFIPEKDARVEGEERKTLGLPEPWWKWHDSLTRFDGPVVRELERHFHERFVLDGGQDYDLPPPDPARGAHLTRGVSAKGSRRFTLESAQVVTNEPNDRQNAVRELYVRLISEAQSSIFIENPYFYHPALVDALCEAKRQRPALDVTLVLPAGEWNDNSFAHDAQQHEYVRYLERGIAVYEYQNHFNHLKIAVFDARWSIHGSTNGNFRSLEDDKDFELNVLIDDEPFARHVLERVRDVDVQHARQITQADVHGSLAAFRIRHRDPRTLLLLSKRLL